MNYILLISILLILIVIFILIRKYILLLRQVRLLPKYPAVTIDNEQFSRMNLTIPLSDQTKIAAYRYTPKIDNNGVTIIVLHGFQNTALKPVEVQLASALATRGYNVFSYDIRGHGHSTEKVYCHFTPDYYYRAMVEDSKEILNYIKNQNGIDRNKLIVIGFSYGGTIALSGMLLDKDVKSIFSGCSIHDYNELWQYHLKNSPKNLEWATKKVFFHNKSYKHFIEAFKSISPKNFAHLKDENQTVFLLHCKNDPIVPYEISFNKNFQSFNVKSENTLVFEDGGHDFKNHHEEVLQKLLYWLDKEKSKL